MRVKILVIDDEEAICEILKYNLEKDGYEVDCAYSAEEALQMDLASYSLFIVDVMMDRLSGFDFARRLKNNPATEFIPVIFCTALLGEDDKVMGLNMGADDYITKPFVINEVLARVRAVLRRAHVWHHPSFGGQQAPVVTTQQPTQPAAVQTPEREPDITFRTLRIDQNEKVCYLDNNEVPLTRTEFDILSFFLTHRGRIYSRDEIIRQVWSSDVVVSARTIDTNITRLRKKLGQYSANIVTRLGFGYGFKENNE